MNLSMMRKKLLLESKWSNNRSVFIHETDVREILIYNIVCVSPFPNKRMMRTGLQLVNGMPFSLRHTCVYISGLLEILCLWIYFIFFFFSFIHSVVRRFPSLFVCSFCSIRIPTLSTSTFSLSPYSRSHLFKKLLVHIRILFVCVDIGVPHFDIILPSPFELEPQAWLSSMLCASLWCGMLCCFMQSKYIMSLVGAADLSFICVLILMLCEHVYFGTLCTTYFAFLQFYNVCGISFSVLLWVFLLFVFLFLAWIQF